MIQDMNRFGWRIGMILIFAMPSLYVAATIVPAFFPDHSHPVVQTLLTLQMVVPGIFMTIAIGVALCLMVQIERHLNPAKKDQG